MQDNPNNIRVRHIHDADGRLTHTLATQFLDEAKTQLAVAVAHCNPKDTPSRKMGHRIAVGRLEAFLAGRSSKFVTVQARDHFIANLKLQTAESPKLLTE